MKKFGILLGVCLAFGARAVEITETKTFSLGPGQTAFALQFAKFNQTAYPATPFLQYVRVTLDATFSGGFTFYNPSLSSEMDASGSVGNARVLITPLGTGLLAPSALDLGLNGSAHVPAAVMSADPDLTASPPDAYQIDGEAFTSPSTSRSSAFASATQATRDAYSGTGTVSYDVDFAPLYVQMVTASPSSATCLLSNDRVTGQLTVTYSAENAPPTGGVVDSFGAVWAGPGLVVINWRTGVESNLMGFYLERAVSPGNWRRVSPGLVPALGGTQPNAYRVEDANVDQTGQVKYRLLGVNLRSEITVLGEAVVQVGINGSLEITASGLRLGVQGLPNARVFVEETTDLVHGPWIRSGPVLLDASGSGAAVLTVSDSETVRFYRLLEE